jgi:ATP-binding cassette, subfamily B, bacterial MsbA
MATVIREKSDPEIPADLDSEASEQDTSTIEMAMIRREPTPLTRGEVARRLLEYLKPHWVKIVLGLLCGALVGVATAGVGTLIERFINSLTLARPDSRYIGAVCAAVVGVYAILGLLRYGQNILLATVAQYVGLNLRRDVYAHLQMLSLAFYQRRRTGALMSALTNDINKLQNAANLLKDVVSAPIQAVILLIAMFILNWRLTLFSLIAVPLMALTVQRLTRRLRGISRQTQEKMADVASVMEETLSAPRVVRAFSAEQHEVERFESENRAAVGMQLKGIRRSARLGPVVDFIGSFGIALVLYYGGMQVVANNMTSGGLIKFLYLVSQVANAASAMSNLRGHMEDLMGAADRIFTEVLDVVPEVRDAPDAKPLPEKIDGRIEFRNVTFAYERGVPILDNLDLTIEPGEVVAFVGETGAGKTTLADLVPRFYDPTAGQVLLDGKDIRTVTIASLRAQIGIVPQDTVLFSGTIRDNIAYGRRDALDSEVEAAARAANAHDFIMSKPDGYLTWVGERGTTLSGGQKQRIAIARALLADPCILILDEATSALDAATESQVQEALETLMEGRTTIIIAHRLSTIVNADKIVVLQKTPNGGRIAEMGTHRELMARGGVYAGLYEVQRRSAEAVFETTPVAS